MLSERLKTVAKMVTKGNIVADIGTDHGYVPIYLIENNICERAYAMDINEGPIDIARNNIEIRGLGEKIKTIKSDGMDKLEDFMAQSVIIAGMGGDLIVNILTRGENIHGIEELILSPHRRVDLVREYLIVHNWEIIDEKMLVDGGKYYTVLRAKTTQKTTEYSEVEKKYGKILLGKKDKVLKQFLEKEYTKFEHILNTMKKSKSKNIVQIEQVLSLNREAYSIYD